MELHAQEHDQEHDMPPSEALYRQYQEPLLAYIRSVVNDPALAEDLTHDTFVSALAARQPVSTIHNPQAWLYRIATNAAIEAVRRRQRRERLAPTLNRQPDGRLSDLQNDHLDGADARDLDALGLLADTTTTDLGEQVATTELVHATLQRLPPTQRTALLLYHLSGRSHAEIAARLHSQERGVKMLLSRARSAFLKQYALVEAGPPGARQSSSALLVAETPCASGDVHTA